LQENNARQGKDEELGRSLGGGFTRKKSRGSTGWEGGQKKKIRKGQMVALGACGWVKKKIHRALIGTENTEEGRKRGEKKKRCLGREKGGSFWFAR